MTHDESSSTTIAGWTPGSRKIEKPPYPHAQSGRSNVVRRESGATTDEAMMCHAQGAFGSARLPPSRVGKSRRLELVRVSAMERGWEATFARAMSSRRMGGMDGSSTGAMRIHLRARDNRLQSLRPKPPWETLGAIPEMLQTAWGSLSSSLRLEKRRASADPRRRRHLVGVYIYRTPSLPRRLATLNAKNCCARQRGVDQSVYRYRLDSLNRSRKSVRRESTKCLNGGHNYASRTRYGCRPERGLSFA